jgi:rod shape-determining protein MreC
MLLLSIAQWAKPLWLKLKTARVGMVSMLVSCIIIAGLANFSASVTHGLSTWAVTVNGSILRVFSFPAEWLVDFKNYFNDRIIIKEINQLKLENESLRDELYRVQLHNLELQSMSAALNFATPKGADFISARVVRASIDPRNKVLLMQVGSVHGVELSSYIVAAHGVVGKVTEVGPYSSKVKAITAWHYKTPVITSSSRQKAIVMGDIDGGDYMDVIYCTNMMALQDAEMVLTSGDGGVYPYGLPVGIVKREGDKVIIMPLFDIMRLEFVKVMK